MRKKMIFALAAVLAFTSLDSAAAESGMRLWYDRPAEFFEEAIVIGNGRLGAVIYGDPVTDRLSLNDITLWTGEPEGEPYNPEAYKAIPEVREALDKGDYRAADSLQRKIQGHFSENYQPLGTLTITHNRHKESKITDYHRELSLRSALASTEYSSDGEAVTTEYIASSPDSVIAIRITSSRPEGLDFTLRFDSMLPHEVSSEGNRITATGHTAYESFPSYYQTPTHHKYDPQRGTRFMTVVATDAPESTVTANTDGSLTVKGGLDATIYVTNATSFAGFDKNPATEGLPYRAMAESVISKAEKSKFADIQKRHEADYHRLFNRVSLKLGNGGPSLDKLPTDKRLKLYTTSGHADPGLEELYFQFGRYLLISSSRTPGVPANLQGLWCEDLLPPWSSNYTVNINLEENYWPACVTNLPELQLPLLDFISNLSENGRQTARAFYGVDRGWCLGHNSDIWAMTNPVGLNSGDPSWANWNMGGTWLANHIWEQYTFQPDTALLRKYYPVMKGAAEFCIDWLTEDKNGHLITSPGTSPENKFISPDGYHTATSAGSTSDLAMTRECLMNTRDAALVLGADPHLVAEIDGILPKIAPYRIGYKGNLCEWPEDFEDAEPTHRHQSHLFGVYPGHHITPKTTPKLAKAACRTLELKGDETTGWSTGWRVNLYARLLEPERAYSTYRRLLRYVSPDKYQGEDASRGGGTYPNLLDAHSPFQIDGNFGGTAGVAEMLIQSTPEEITLLPSLPEAWAKEGYAKGLLARGGWTVSFQWKDGLITDCTLISEGPASTRLRIGNMIVPVVHTVADASSFHIPANSPGR